MLIKNVIIPTIAVKSVKVTILSILEKAINPITIASMLTDIPKMKYILKVMTILSSFSIIPSFIISIPTIAITIPPITAGTEAIFSVNILPPNPPKIENKNWKKPKEIAKENFCLALAPLFKPIAIAIPKASNETAKAMNSNSSIAIKDLLQIQ